MLDWQKFDTPRPGATGLFKSWIYHTPVYHLLVMFAYRHEYGKGDGWIWFIFKSNSHELPVCQSEEGWTKPVFDNDLAAMGAAEAAYAALLLADYTAKQAVKP